MPGTAERKIREQYLRIGMEMDDTLRLALAVGRNSSKENGVNAVYTRSTDVYDTPYQKAEMGNEAGADYFVSLHRNAASEPGKVRAS